MAVQLTEDQTKIMTDILGSLAGLVRAELPMAEEIANAIGGALLGLAAEVKWAPHRETLAAELAKHNIGMSQFASAYDATTRQLEEQRPKAARPPGGNYM